MSCCVALVTNTASWQRFLTTTKVTPKCQARHAEKDWVLSVSNAVAGPLHNGQEKMKGENKSLAFVNLWLINNSRNIPVCPIKCRPRTEGNSTQRLPPGHSLKRQRVNSSWVQRSLRTVTLMHRKHPTITKLSWICQMQWSSTLNWHLEWATLFFLLKFEKIFSLFRKSWKRCKSSLPALFWEEVVAVHIFYR